MNPIDDLVAKSERSMSTQRDEVRLLLELSRMDLDNRGRVVLMSLGIAGVVVPLLANSSQITNPTLLIYATASLLASAIAGVVAQAVDRHFRNTLMTVHGRYVAASFLAGVRNDPGDVQQAQELQMRIATLNRRRSSVGDLEDAALYLLFVVGVVLLIAAVLLTLR
jgi:hypothetical protein